MEYHELVNVDLSVAPAGFELFKWFQPSMAGRGGATFRGVGRRNPRMRRQERGRRKVKRLSKSKHITCKKVNKGGLFCLNGSQGESGGSQVCLQYKMHGQWIGFLNPRQ